VPLESQPFDILPVAGVVAAIVVALSLAAYAVYAFDKRAAVAGRRRVPESTLLLLGVAGGWPGALVAQQTLRHKTRKQPFQLVFWASVVVNVAVLVGTVYTLTAG